MRVLVIIAGIILAAIGGVVAYRALFIEPSAAVVITNNGTVKEVPNYAQIVAGSLAFAGGATVAFLVAIRSRRNR